MARCGPRRPRHRFGRCQPILAALMASQMWTAFAQTATNPNVVAGVTGSGGESWKFEVVSIRQNKEEAALHYGLPQFEVTRDGWRMADGQLALAILTAYVPQAGGDVIYTGKRVQGLPEWTLNDRYDIDARIAQADLALWQTPASQAIMVRSMLQAMLVERCKLAVHRDTKVLPVYLLTVGKNGPQFKETVPGAPRAGGTPVPGGGVVVTEDDGKTMHFYGVVMGSLTSLLGNWTGRPVLDKTGLKDRYDLRLQRPDLGSPTAPGDASTLGSRPTTFSAVEDLGLKLEPAKEPVDTLVVDHVERPSEN
jgi:bla regulator protein BlaR1